MYSTAGEYLYNIRKIPTSNLYSNPQILPFPTPIVRENYSTVPEEQTKLQMRWHAEKIKTTTNPQVWGPAFWFSLHNSALHYPINPSPIVRERMKARILAIPYEIPCPACKPHALAFIENNSNRLDDIVSSRDKLFKFYVDFHNKVNERYGKPIFTYEQAYKLYSSPVSVSYLSYKNDK
jgi:hypothetical protein